MYKGFALHFSKLRNVSVVLPKMFINRWTDEHFLLEGVFCLSLWRILRVLYFSFSALD